MGMPREIVFIADDLGMSEDVNRAIVHAHRHGALDGASLMLGQPATRHAVRLARETPTLAVGWHLHLNDSLPLTAAAWPWGRTVRAAGVALGLSARRRAFARREIRAQWEAFRATGLSCRFVNAHHHIHAHPFVIRQLVATVGPELGGWLRWGRPRFFARRPAALAHRALGLALQSSWRRRLPYRTSATLWGLDRTFAMRASEVEHALATLGDGLHEFMFHPRRIENDPDTDCLLQLAGQRRSRGETTS